MKAQDRKLNNWERSFLLAVLDSGLGINSLAVCSELKERLLKYGLGGEVKVTAGWNREFAHLLTNGSQGDES